MCLLKGKENFSSFIGRNKKLQLKRSKMMKTCSWRKYSFDKLSLTLLKCINSTQEKGHFIKNIRPLMI